ncbi:MAG: hypothetical protein HOP19_24665, partial [Acidobacteria bacterium]|nr:hypothetical protein [Acidobacteriota bacterium]
LLGALQNVVTGIYIQPYHYLHYFARPTTNLALVALWVWGSSRWLSGGRSRLITQYVNVAALTLCLCVAVIFQLARYRDVASLAREAVEAQPALQALRNHTVTSAVVFCPETTAREAIPLYTNAVAYFSRHMLLNETPRTETATQARIVAMQWLVGMSAAEFSAWTKTRPVDVFFQHLQRPANAQTQSQINAVIESLMAQFARWEREPNVEALLPLRYALLQKKMNLDSTRLLRYFHCQMIWSDEHYALFSLERR